MADGKICSCIIAGVISHIIFASGIASKPFRSPATISNIECKGLIHEITRRTVSSNREMGIWCTPISWIWVLKRKVKYRVARLVFDLSYKDSLSGLHLIEKKLAWVTKCNPAIVILQIVGLQKTCPRYTL
jgi:hypothetical protein